MALFGLFTWGYNTYAATADDQKLSIMRRINKADLRFQIISASALVLTGLISWWNR